MEELPEVGTAVSLATQLSAALPQALAALSAKLSEAEAVGVALREREAKLKVGEAAINEREAKLKVGEAAVNEREAKLKVSEAELAAREAELIEREKRCTASEAAMRAAPSSSNGTPKSAQLMQAQEQLRKHAPAPTFREPRMSEQLQKQILARATATAMLKHRLALAKQQRAELPQNKSTA